MAPRRKVPAPDFSFTGNMPGDDPIEDALRADEENVAEALGGILDELKSAITDDASVWAYKGGAGKGAWAYCDVFNAPINVDTMMNDMRDKWGAGTFQLRVRAKGRIVTTKQIEIAGDPNPKRRPVEEVANTNNMTEMMLQQAAQSKSDMLAMMTMMNSQQQNSQNMMMTMMAQSQQQMVALMGVMMGGKDKTSEVMASLAPFLANKSDNMGEMLKTAAAMKELFAGEGGGSDKSFFEQAAGALMPTIVGAATGMMGQGQGEQPQLPPQPHTYLPNPQQRPQGQQPAQVPVTRDPIISLISGEVLFYAARGFDPTAAADQIVNTLQTNGVPLDAVNTLVLRIGQSPDWLMELARHGLDLRQYHEWAQHFLQALVVRYSAISQASIPAGGETGGGTNPSDDGEPVA